jgi:hypothetical protein
VTSSGNWGHSEGLFRSHGEDVRPLGATLGSHFGKEIMSSLVAALCNLRIGYYMDLPAMPANTDIEHYLFSPCVRTLLTVGVRRQNVLMLKMDPFTYLQNLLSFCFRCDNAGLKEGERPSSYHSGQSLRCSSTSIQI